MSKLSEKLNKVILEPRVSPAFPITCLCNHCNIRFDHTLVKVRKRSLTPRWPLIPKLLRSHVWLYPRIIVSKSHENTFKYVDTVTHFAKTWTKGHWPLDDLWPPHLLRSHVWLCSRIIVSKSHGNTSIYVDTVINFANYHIHTTYIRRTTYRMSDHIVTFRTQFRRDNNGT